MFNQKSGVVSFFGFVFRRFGFGVGKLTFWVGNEEARIVILYSVSIMASTIYKISFKFDASGFPR